MDGSRKAIILAGGKGTRLYPITRAVSKQLLHIYDKPMIYYPLSIMMLARLQDILVISTPDDLPRFRELLAGSEEMGLRLSYAEQPSPAGIAQALLIAEEYLAGSPSALVLGDNIFYGHGLSDQLATANRRFTGATLFAHHVSMPEAYGVVEFDADGAAVRIEEKPRIPKSNWAVTGLYFYDAMASTLARELKPSARGELEITDLNNLYLRSGKLHVERLGRGCAWLDTGTVDSLMDAATYVATVERRQGLKIACLEEIAWQNGWIDDEQLRRLASPLGKSGYGEYLLSLLERK